MSDGLRNSVSGEEDLVFSASPSGTNSGVKVLPGPVICDVAGTCGIPTRTGLCGLGDTRTSGASRIPPGLEVSSCREACVELCVCVPAEGRDGEDGLRGSGSLFVGPIVGISPGVLKTSKEIRDCVEFVPKVRACLNKAIT